MKTKLLILSILLSSILAIAGGSPTRFDSRNESPAITPLSTPLSLDNTVRDTANTIAQTPLFSREKLRELKKEIKEIRHQQKRQALDSTATGGVEPMAVASFLSSMGAYGFSIMALAFPPLILLAPLLAILGIVLGAVSLGKMKRNETTGSGFSIAGIVLGSILLFLAILVVVLVVSFLASITVS